MLHHRIILVGRKARDPLLEAAADYLARLGHYAKAEVVLIRDGTLDEQTASFHERLADNTFVIALDERGTMLSSTDLARKIERWEHTGPYHLAWLIGGADGLHASVLARAKMRLSLSPMTLPHRLAQVMLLEQLYRAHTIVRGERYHCGH